MSKYDTFTEALRNDLRERGATLADAAEAAKISLRQFNRHVRGEIKGEVMPYQTVAELRRESMISEGTVGYYVREVEDKIKQLVRRKRNGRPLRATLQNLLKKLYTIAR